MWIWEPSDEWTRSTNVWRFIQRLGLGSREEFLRFSTAQPEAFWAELVREIRLEWFEPYQQVLDTSRGVEWARWFTGGRLNIVHNCLDRHVVGPARANPAIVWEGENGDSREISFGELAARVNALARHLLSLGIQPGDRVAMCMPMTPDVVAILYACLKLGLVAVPIFAGFGAGAIAARLADSGARCVFTAEHLERRGKRLALAEKVRQAATRAPSVEHIITDCAGQPGEPIATASLDSETPALLLYTSGTTGMAKGCVHTHAGALVQTAKEIYLAFDHRDADRFFWLSDIGWMMGPWTILGNHHFGGTIFIYDGAPDFPAPGGSGMDRLWQMLERHRITTFGMSPTAIRTLMHGSDPARYDLSALRLLGSSGEPWDESSYMWFFENVGRRRAPIINISGGTEIIGCFLFPLPIQPLKPCTLGSPAPGMAAVVLDDAGQPVAPGVTGYLACTAPAPSMTRGVWGRPDRYIETYWSKWPNASPNIWFHGDWASVDEDGCWFLHGRADESMNVSGRKVGPGEVEDALLEHPGVAEAAVIGVPDEIKGEAIVGFVVPKPGESADSLWLDAVARTVVDSLGPPFRPRAVHAVIELPKTQSGKIVRRLIRQAYLGHELGDVSTVQNPAALDSFGKLYSSGNPE
ncbi:MAG TPA: AMP-binding protein [Bryobacteraceae bacterium]|nr:AMP-binding protein [Bryobacteraceae bacterium]